MTRNHKRQILFSVAMTVLTLLLGLAGGLLLGCAVVLFGAQGRLADYALKYQVRADNFLEESFRMLEQLNASPLAACSAEDMQRMRTRVFRSEFIRDIGRVQQGKIVCSAVMGGLGQPITAPLPEYTENYAGKTFLHHRSFPPYDGGDNNDAIQSGSYYIVLSNFRHDYLMPPPFQFVRRVGDFNMQLVRKILGKSFDLARYPLDRDGTLYNGGLLMVTRCQSRLLRPSCTTAYVSTHAIFKVSHSQIELCTFAGGVVGLFLGLFWILFFRRTLGMERQLRRAIRRNKIQLLYQPIVELNSGRVVEAEALARWSDEDGFAVSPAVFVPVAEQFGFVGELTGLVVSKALHDLHPMLESNPDFRVNVNVSALDLASESFLPMLERALDEAGVAAPHLAIEVTESSTAKGPRIQQTIQELRRRGHSVQIDDFGTGYSSLSYLHDLSVDAIKIDRAFTQSIGTEAVTVGILPQILAMARALNLQVIAEGIETPEQAAYFAGSEGGVMGQGWLFGRPMPLDILLERLESSRRDAAAQV